MYTDDLPDLRQLVLVDAQQRAAAWCGSRSTTSRSYRTWSG
nr:hypothetical protein [Methylobacterium sp. B34]